MKVCELQVIVNDLYDSFVNDVTTKSHAIKNLPLNRRLEKEPSIQLLRSKILPSTQ